MHGVSHNSARHGLFGLGLLMVTALFPVAAAYGSDFGGRFSSARAETGASKWDRSLASKVRLIAGQTGAIPVDGAAALEAGIEIALDPEWKTYWSSPGDTGIAPMFSFERSDNVAAVEVAYPMPQRFDLPGDISFGYEDQVVFPLTVTPQVPGAPVSLVADIVYGACEELCIPVEATAELVFPAATGIPTRFADLIDQWRARVPADHSATLDAVTAGGQEDGRTLEVMVTGPSAFADPVLIARPTGGLGRIYLGTPVRAFEGRQASFVFPVKTRRDRPGLEAGVELSFTLSDEGSKQNTMWAQQFEYHLLPTGTSGGDEPAQ